MVSLNKAFGRKKAAGGGVDDWAVPQGDDWVVPKETPPNSHLKRAFTDIPSEIYHAGSEAIEGMKNLVPGSRDRSKEGTLESIGKTGRGLLAIPELPLSLLTGTARSIIGHGLAAVEDYGNRLNNKPVDPEASYKHSKGDADTAMMAMGPRGVPRLARPAIPAARAPHEIPANQPSYQWDAQHPPVQAPRQPDTIGDFDVPLTAGEASGDFSQIALERRALRGGEGTPAQRVAEGFMDMREGELARARRDVSREMDPQGGQVLTDTPLDAAALAQRGVRQTADDIRASSRDRYEEVRNLPGEFHRDAFTDMTDGIRRELSAGNNPVIIDDRTTPIATQALADIENRIGQLRVQNNAAPGGQPNPNNIVAINLEGLDAQRKRLVRFYQDTRGPIPTPDQRATQAILHAFDNHIEQAITQGLFSGDPRALQALQEARGLHSTYRRLFTHQGSGDEVGGIMQRILGDRNREPATPTEIANYLYGTANVGAKGLSHRLAGRLQEVLGTQSPEWTAVKQGLWQRLAEAPDGTTGFGPEKAANRISKFLNGDGQALAQRMFSAGERDLMRRYGEVLRQTIPPPGAVNYSNNLQWAAQMREGVTKYLTALVGEHIGGPAGAILGFGVGAAGAPIKNQMNARKIAQAMPSVADSLRQWNRAVAIAARTGQPSTAALRLATTNLITKMESLGGAPAPAHRD